MLLALTSSEDATASYLLPQLEKRGVRLLRIDTDLVVANSSISYRSGSASMKLGGKWLDSESVTNVWYRRPERLKDVRFDGSPEGRYTLAEWTECIEGFFAHIPEHLWVNHPARNAVASHKIEQLTTARALGFKIPDTLVTQDRDMMLSFYRTHERIVAKPMASGYVERGESGVDSLIYTNLISKEDLDDLTDLALCPTLFQEYIDKSYDVRISVVDDEIHAVSLSAADDTGHQRCDIRRNNMMDVRYELVALPSSINAAIVALMKHYQLRFGAIDMAVSKTGKWYFLEINPNGQWAWLDLYGVSNITASFVRLFSRN